MERAEKHEFVTALNEVLSGTTVLVVAHYAGLSVAQMTALRSKVRESGGSVRVAKNRLVKLALQGTELEHVSGLFKGPTLIAFSSDPVAAPKAMVEFAKTTDKFVILGGALGKTNLNAEGVKSLATMPSLEELRARLVGMIQTPASRIAQVVNAPAGQLARVFGAYAKKDEAA
ncbi:50S ribosomal protein L10 [Pannonibacter sp. SL95]|uniref:50S ribosomal protein L10 n=1 Tax=Pannonibacter sp. SL95 TaxID=2995153 RepID=UPI0022733072|nr:50S ribosomal protein L10 [Pannonibacter sp. SL95]MCY1705879.1 50S ribosomal protein L10 [Pannonibacter sp. SL95]